MPRGDPEMAPPFILCSLTDRLAKRVKRRIPPQAVPVLASATRTDEFKKELNIGEEAGII
jgi:hypothetical protein